MLYDKKDNNDIEINAKVILYLLRLRDIIEIYIVSKLII